jgi:hypothetical protein
VVALITDVAGVGTVGVEPGPQEEQLSPCCGRGSAGKCGVVELLTQRGPAGTPARLEPELGESLLAVNHCAVGGGFSGDQALPSPSQA